MNPNDELHDAAMDVEMSNTGTGLAVFDKGQHLSVVLLTAINDGRPYFYSSIVNKTHEERLNNVRLLSSADNNIEDIIEPKSFIVSNVIITKATFTDDRGETVTTPKLILIDSKGKGITIMAKVWVTQFLNLFSICGLPPWEKPIKVSAKRVKGNGANHYYTLILP
jgi:hypothetical protein